MANKQSIRKITTSGRSRAITLPLDFLSALHWKEKQKLVVELDASHRRLIIRDWKS